MPSQQLNICYGENVRFVKQIIHNMANEAELMIIICLVYGIQKGCFTRKDLVNKIYIVHS